MLWPWSAGCYFPPTFDEKYAHRKTKRQVIRDFDFVGLILLVGGLLIFLMGVSWGGQLYPWKSAHVLATIVVGFFVLVAFTLYEALVPLKEPLIPMYLFKNLGWAATMMMVAMGAYSRTRRNISFVKAASWERGWSMAKGTYTGLRVDVLWESPAD